MGQPLWLSPGKSGPITYAAGLRTPSAFNARSITCGMELRSPEAVTFTIALAISSVIGSFRSVTPKVDQGGFIGRLHDLDLIGAECPISNQLVNRHGGHPQGGYVKQEYHTKQGPVPVCQTPNNKGESNSFVVPAGRPDRSPNGWHQGSPTIFPSKEGSTALQQ